MPRDKVFVYVTRETPEGPQLLVFASHDEPGFEVPKGAVEPGESLADAVRRELLEETGIAEVRILRVLGSTRWQDERQHFFLVNPACPVADRFDHCVTGLDEDRGLWYRFEWISLGELAASRLVQGSHRFLDALQRWTSRQSPALDESPDPESPSCPVSG